MQDLTASLFLHMAPEDLGHLKILAEQADCKPQQLARYFIRKAIHEKLTGAPAKGA